MLTQLFYGLDTHVKGLPAWMKKMNPDKMSAKDRQHILSSEGKHEKAARKSCLETEKNGARQLPLQISLPLSQQSLLPAEFITSRQEPSTPSL
mmetsp:Transcript_45010/g.70577  ORF Transcript_45010/g.70577 Transcript_45010/m.70577 type:complete len:93 (+) Transcript_45010:93-371(+)